MISFKTTQTSIGQTLSNSQHIQEDAYISQQYNEQNKHAYNKYKCPKE